MLRKFAWSYVLVVAISACEGDNGLLDVVQGAELPAETVGVLCSADADCATVKAPDCVKVVCGDEGLCELVVDAMADGSVCDHDDLCAITPKLCNAGVCEYTSRIECPSVPCMIGECEPASGECVYEPTLAGSPCEADGNPCTMDICDGGVCVAGENVCPCKEDIDCDQSEDKCAAPQVCDIGAKVCRPNNEMKIVCPPEGACVSYKCNSLTGACDEVFAGVGTPCADAGPCSLGGVCDGGGNCVEASPCDDENQCTQDECDGETGICTHDELNGVPCGAVTECHGVGMCNQGKCVFDVLVCDDENVCTFDECVDAIGCEFTGMDGGECDDLDPCTASDLCSGGVCVGNPVDCDDHDPCTDDSCNPVTGWCAHDDNVDFCDDGNVCTVGDRCSVGVCEGGALTAGCCNYAADCDDYDACTVEECVDHLCVRHGQIQDACMGLDDGGCMVGMCDPATGSCIEADLSMPRVIVDYLVEDGVWPVGAVGARGRADVDGTDGGTEMRLPGRVIPAGVRVLVVELEGGDCDGLWLRRGSGVEEAADGAGAGACAWSWADGRRALEASVVIGAGTAVSRMTAYLWAVGTCRPLGPVQVAEGDTIEDLSIAGDPTGVFVGFRKGFRSFSREVDLEKTHGSTSLVHDSSNFSIGPGRFKTSIARRSDGTVVMAYGGADGRIRLAELGTDSSLGVPLDLTIDDPTEQQFEPSIAADGENGLWIAFSTMLGGSADLAVARINEDFDVEIRSVWRDQLHSAYRPKLIVNGHTALLFWVSESSGTPMLWGIEHSRISSNETGSILHLDSENVEITGLDTISGDGLVAVVWTRANKSTRGGLIDLETMGLVEEIDFSGYDGSVPEYHSLSSLGSRGFSLLSVISEPPYDKIVQAVITKSGHTEIQTALQANLLLVGADPLVSSRSSTMVAYAFNDSLALPNPGIFLGLTSADCVHGPVDCRYPQSPGVCVGFGATGYLVSQGATGWCK